MGVAYPDPALRWPPGFGLEAMDDAEFAARGPAIADYLYTNFPGLRGLGQRRPHFDPARDRTTDPVEHTVEMIALLDTRGLSAGDVATLRAAAVFHDVGKLVDPLDVRHAVHSTVICPPYLEDFDLTPSQRQAAVAIVANHDTLGRLAQGGITPEEAAALFGTRRVAELTLRLTRADIASIRYLTHVLPNIEAAFQAVAGAFDAQEAVR
jgi:HD domain